jgi:deazaflavin-dependent oxidoreductase (nitroreductase family)
MMSDMNAWNQQLIAEFRANGGKVGGQFAGATLLLLHTRGARTEQPRINPLAYTRDGARYIVIASKGGAPINPDWYYNVVANPHVTVEVGTAQFEAEATIPDEPERTRLYNQMAAVMPGFADYQRNTTRQIPVVVLTPVSVAAGANDGDGAPGE